jgi:hypothetical protein
MFIFNLNVAFTTDFLKMAPIRVRFSPGFPPGAGFLGEEFAPAWFETIIVTIEACFHWRGIRCPNQIRMNKV